MRIGTMFLGKVEEFGNESVQTKFFVLGLPLVPMSSHYVVAEEDNGIEGFEIPLHAKSVLLGYLRIFGWIGALLAGVFAYLEHRHATALFIACAVLSTVALWTTFFVGGLSKREILRRMMLKSVTGVGAPPEFLPSDMVANTSDRLLGVWQDQHAGKDWTVATEASGFDPLLFALAEFQMRPDLASRVLAQMER